MDKFLITLILVFSSMTIWAKQDAQHCSFDQQIVFQSEASSEEKSSDEEEEDEEPECD